MFTKEEKIYINPKTGKPEWITTKKGLFRGESRTPISDKLISQNKPQTKAINKKKWDKRTETVKRTATRINKALDWIEGKPPITKKTMPKPTKKHYIIKNGVAYPIHQQRQQKPQKKPSSKKKNISYQAWEFKL